MLKWLSLHIILPHFPRPSLSASSYRGPTSPPKDNSIALKDFWFAIPGSPYLFVETSLHYQPVYLGYWSARFAKELQRRASFASHVFPRPTEPKLGAIREAAFRQLGHCNYLLMQRAINLQSPLGIILRIPGHSSAPRPVRSRISDRPLTRPSIASAGAGTDLDILPNAG